MAGTGLIDHIKDILANPLGYALEVLVIYSCGRHELFLNGDTNYWCPRHMFFIRAFSNTYNNRYRW